jgi:hypothetical protein
LCLIVRKYNNEAHSKNAEYVLIERFGKLLEWFGPLHPSNDIVSRVSSKLRFKIILHWLVNGFYALYR